MGNRVNFLALAVLLSVAPYQHAGAQTSTPWSWRLDGNVFAGVNHQHRNLTDFSTFESQNWFMGEGERAVGSGKVRLFSMLSLEPFTLKKRGSPQVFQTGETFDNQPLVDYQHPHDMIPALGLSYGRPMAGWTLTTEASVVGAPALGPLPFMHRPSAAENPQAPLSHHSFDSTHATPGVLTVALARNSARVDASWFRGREPDERRTDIDLGPLDSWSVRGSWKRDAWDAQISGGHLNDAEIAGPGHDVIRLTASVAHTHSGPVSTVLFAAWGQNREVNGVTDAFLFESNVSWLDGNYLYSRTELVTKDFMHLDAHEDTVAPAGFRPFSRVGAFTLGYTRDLNRGMRGRIGIGGDVTMYHVPSNLKEHYGGPVSLHVFLRYRFTSAAMLAGMNH
jgi:hypothetical protein